MLNRIIGKRPYADSDEVRYTRFPVKPARTRVIPRNVPPAPERPETSLKAERADRVKQVVRVVSGSNEGAYDIPVSTLHRALASRAVGLKA